MAGYERDDSLPDVAVPWSDIPISDVVEPGLYVLRVGHFKEIKAKESGKRMAVMFSSIDEGPLAGVQFPIQNYVLGSDNDPLCNLDPQTWRVSFGGRQLNQVLAACGTARVEASLEQSLRRSEGARFRAYVTKTLQKTGDYEGKDQNRITKVAAYGEELTAPGQGKGPMIAPGQVNGPMVSRQRVRPMVGGQDPAIPEQSDHEEPVVAQVHAEGVPAQVEGDRVME